MSDSNRTAKSSVVQIGDVYGKWLVLGLSERSVRKVRWWDCRCGCGVEKPVCQSSLRSGRSKSCNSCGNTRHGMRFSIEHKPWVAMIQRCTNEKHHAYDDYGGRGITVFQEWRDSFEAFFRDMGPRPSLKYSIERIDNSKGYEPGNCKWATDIEQHRNKRNNVLLTLNGKTMCLAAWAEETGLKNFVIQSRKQLGWSDERTLTTPVDKRFSHPKTA